jgi:hypothetical protein
MKQFIGAVFAVLSAFVGIRKRSAANKDQALKPIHFVVAGLLCVAVVISLLVTLVRLVVARAG